MSEISQIVERNNLIEVSAEENNISLNVINKNIYLNKNKYLDYISFVKIISAYSVIILHTNPFWDNNYKNYKSWIFANFIEQFFIFGVPFFVLCIGATLVDFNEKYGLKEYFIRRFYKVVLPLLGWNILSFFYRRYFLNNLTIENFDLVTLLNIFFENKLYGLFRSFHIFIITYMIIPLLAYVEKQKKIKIYSYCFCTLLITQSLIPYLINIFKLNISWPYKIEVGYIIYIFSGYIIQNHRLQKSINIFIYIIGFFAFLIQLIGCHILTYRHNKINFFHTGFLKLPTILYCNSLFLFIKEYYYLLTKIVTNNVIKKLGSLTIGPFFLHYPVINFFQKYPKIIFGIKLFTFYGGTFICIICFILTYILKKII